MDKYIDISRQLLNCVKVLGQILENKDVNDYENIRIKYTAKTIEHCCDIIKNSPVQVYYVFNSQKLAGKITIDDSNKAWSIDIDIVLCGSYSITPLLDKGKISAFMLEQKK